MLRYSQGFQTNVTRYHTILSQAWKRGYSSINTESEKKQEKTDQIQLPSKARAVIIGGGIIGCSVAYHLTKIHGWRNEEVVLLERDKITSGTTWHAAGLMVTFGSKSETSTELRKYTKWLYSQLEEETGQSSGFMPVGFIELASSKDRLEEFRRVAAFNRRCGVDVHEIGAKDVKDLFPLCKTDDILAGFYVKDDGRVNPVDATMGLMKGTKMYGGKVIEGVAVTSIVKDKNKVTGVKTTAGEIQCEYVINCAGMWARQLGELAGVSIPNQAAEHYYLITDKIPEVQSHWPVIEDPDSYTYIRPEGSGLMVGLFEPKAAAWNVHSIPNSFSFGEIAPDWDRMVSILSLFFLPSLLSFPFSSFLPYPLLLLPLLPFPFLPFSLPFFPFFPLSLFFPSFFPLYFSLPSFPFPPSFLALPLSLSLFLPPPSFFPVSSPLSFLLSFSFPLLLSSSSFLPSCFPSLIPFLPFLRFQYFGFILSFSSFPLKYIFFPFCPTSKISNIP